MKLYLLSLGAGVLAGVLYGLINVRSPAPPVIALIGLAGILIGEQAVPLVRGLLERDALAGFLPAAVIHVFGHLPGRGRRATTADPPAIDPVPNRAGTPSKPEQGHV